MEVQYFFGRIPAAGSMLVFPECGSRASSLFWAEQGDDTNGGVNEGSNHVIEGKDISSSGKGNTRERAQRKTVNAARNFYDGHGKTSDSARRVAPRQALLTDLQIHRN
jgi:hypothetical protein